MSSSTVAEKSGKSLASPEANLGSVPPPPHDAIVADGRREQEQFLNREAAEVYLLLDFLSGRIDKSLRPSQQEQLQALLQDPRNRSDRSQDGGSVAGNDDPCFGITAVLTSYALQVVRRGRTADRLNAFRLHGLGEINP